MTDQGMRDLSAHERNTVEKRAYAGWLERMKIYSPPPQPATTDLVHENRRVMNVLTGIVGVLPAIIGIVMLASITVSLDKTAAAFHAAVANKNWLWGGWAYFVSLAGVVMADAALIVGEFALVRDMLKKGLKRQVWTLESLQRSINVRLGKAEPLDYNEMPDPSLRVYVTFVFWLVVLANIYAVTSANNIKTLGDLDFKNMLLLVVGIAGALSLRFVGQQLAHIVYELMVERKRLEAHEMEEQWRIDMMQMWETDGPRIVQEALHARYLNKNKLPPGTTSPYLLVAGEDAEGNESVEALPLETSPEQSPEQWQTYSVNSNGNGNGNHH